MPHAASTEALKSLTLWWEDMGIAVDRDVIKAYFRETAAPKTDSTPRLAATQAEVAKPRKRKKSKSIDDWTAEAKQLAAACSTAEDLKAAIEAFDGCALKEGAQNTVVFVGTFGAPLMVIGEGPGAQEDAKGLPFVGKAGQLLDKMLAAIGQTRADNTLITNVNYWRPPGNRNPEAEELAVCRPFVDRMIELSAPKLIVTAGGVPTKALLNTKNGIMRLRGKEDLFRTDSGIEVPLIPILHPAYLLRRSQDKSRAWRDLLLIEERLKALS